MNVIDQQLTAAAKKDAADFMQEFPGEKITGDWDAEAFAMLPADLQEAEDAWDTYASALHAAIETALRDREIHG